MQATSPTYREPIGSGWLTTTSLIMIAVFALITLGAIVYGMRLAAQRREARRIEEERIETEASEQAMFVPSDVALSAGPAVSIDAPPVVDTPSRAPEPAPTPPPPAATPLPAASDADPFPEAPDLTDEPIVAAAPFEASPAVEAESAPVEVPDRFAGDRPLMKLKGLGPKVATRLKELGIQNVSDLAALDTAQAEAIDARLGPFTGRMVRDRWVEQAKLLAAGDDKAFEAQFGKL